jgi:hypothetical protein
MGDKIYQAGIDKRLSKYDAQLIDLAIRILAFVFIVSVSITYLRLIFGE